MYDIAVQWPESEWRRSAAVGQREGRERLGRGKKGKKERAVGVVGVVRVRRHQAMPQTDWGLYAQRD